MKDFQDFRGKGKAASRYRLDRKGRDSVRQRGGGYGGDESLVGRSDFQSGKKGRSDGSRMCEYEDEYARRRKFECEGLMDGRRDGDDYRSNRISLSEEHLGHRLRRREFRDGQDLFYEDMSLEMEREQEVLHCDRNVGETCSPQPVDEKLYVPAKNGYSGVCVAERIGGEGLLKEEFARRHSFLRDAGKLSSYPAKSPCFMAPSPSQHKFSRPPMYGNGNLSVAGENPREEKVGFGGFSPEDAGRGFQSDYIPLAKESQYQPHSRTPSPLCVNNPHDYKEQSLVKESIEGNSISRKYFVEEDEVRVSSGNVPQCVISSPYVLLSNAKGPSSAGYGSEEEEYALTREFPATENTANTKDFHRAEGPRNHSGYVYSYMLPSPQYKHITKTFTSQDCASPDIEKAYIAKQAISEWTERERYINENIESGYRTERERYIPSKLEHKTSPSMSVCRANDPVDDTVTRVLPKPQQCLRSRTPLPNYSSLPDTELSQESSMRSEELSPNISDQATRAFIWPKEYVTRNENVTYSGKDVRSRYSLSSNKLNEKISCVSEDHVPEDRLWVHVRNGGDTCGHSQENNLKSSMPLQHYQDSQEPGFIVHPRASVVPSRYNQDFEVLHHCTVPHDVRTNAHYHEDFKNEAYGIQQDKFNLSDNDPDAYFVDEDSYISKRQGNALNPRCFHSSSSCDGILQGNKRALLKGRYEQDNIQKPYVKHQEPIWKRLGEIDDRELENLSRENMQCQMLMRRSAHLQNKDYTGVDNEEFNNPSDLDCQLPFKKLPLRMRLGKPNNFDVSDIKKRPCAHINASQLSKKHKSSSHPNVSHDMQESYQGHSTDPSASKINSEITELDEHSKKFQDQVNRAYLESVKHLFQSSAQQRKFKGLDKYESLRCDICGSSRDFKDTWSLAKHAFSCVKMDLRSQHLGLYKALCVLIGWNNLVSPDYPTKIVQLSESEHSAMKDDLIIWPPVVIVHNISVGNKDLRKQKIITVSKLESILEGEGFGGNNHKVHIGNDQGVMVVKFNATLSGLQAAQELHNFYSKINHGRDELQHHTQNGGSCRNEESQVPEDILYGYLGIVEDLPKLDSQIKKWSLIKSLKELLATAN